MIIGIDASNIRTGGGKKHLLKFINYSIKLDSDISFVLVSNRKITNEFINYGKVKCITNTYLNSYNFLGLISQAFFSNKYFRENNCNIVFAPGGIFLSRFKPFFIMSQNMLPFDNHEIKNFSFGKKLKFRLIKILQLISFNRSNGVIFLTEYAKTSIQKLLKNKINVSVIPHGILQQSRNYYQFNENTFEILYVSDFLPYKHNFNVFSAVSDLILEGYNINLKLIGKIDKVQFPKMQKILDSNINLEERIKIIGQVSGNKISNYYKKASIFLFASSCENLPFIILEALSFGLPIITTNKSPMKDIVYGDNIFFNSYDISNIKETIKNNMGSSKLSKISEKNYHLSHSYTWQKNVEETLNFFKLNIDDTKNIN
jgi:glycosyltransferase involved in cell wall biosynthesis